MYSAPDLLKKMSNELGLLPGQLEQIINTAPLRYKSFKVPKRSGGERQLAQPAREVKAIQRWIISFLLPQLPVHEAATAYKAQASIKKNAELHRDSNYILKMDFENFFPSITGPDLVKHLDRHCHEDLDDSAVKLITRSCVWTPDRRPPLRLCVGAPSSPLLSNSIMFEFDKILNQYSKHIGAIYSRYADDLTFSTREKHILNEFPKKVISTLKSIPYPSLAINRKKTVFASRAGRRTITGVTLTPDFRLSIGRDRKRRIRAMFHRMTLGMLDEFDRQQLEGYIAFGDDIEPGFRDWLNRSAKQE